MRQAQHRMEVPTPGRGLVEVTADVTRWLATQTITAGLRTIWCPHTSASLVVQENASPDVQKDLETFLSRLVPDGDEGRYRHNEEGPDDMPAHIRAALTQTQLSILIAGGRLVLGIWQGIYIYEHRLRPHRRQLVFHVIGETDRP